MERRTAAGENVKVAARVPASLREWLEERNLITSACSELADIRELPQKLLERAVEELGKRRPSTDIREGYLQWRRIKTKKKGKVRGRSLTSVFENGPDNIAAPRLSVI